MHAVQADPEWYTAALKKLGEIEEHADEYEDPEEGDKAPTPVIFTAVRAFLTTLKAQDYGTLEVPRMFVSPDGQILVSYGDKKRGLDIRFSPELFYYFKHTTQAPKEKEGDNQADVLLLISKHFVVL